MELVTLEENSVLVFSVQMSGAFSGTDLVTLEENSVLASSMQVPEGGGRGGQGMPDLFEDQSSATPKGVSWS